MTALVHILLPVHNRKAITGRFVDCLLAQTYRNWRLVLIDDGSRDGTEAMVRARVPAVTVLRGTGNWWWGGALHQGYKLLKRENPSHDDIVLMINDDTEFDEDFLAQAVRALQPRSLLLSQLYSVHTGEYMEAGVHWDWAAFHWAGVKGDEAGINCFSTRGLFMHFGGLLEIGGFYPVLLPHYLSDYEFTMRANLKGFAMQSAPEVFLRFDDTYTGISGIESPSVLQSLRKAFSRKAGNNPLFWTSFIFLSCPPRYIPRNLKRVWGSFARILLTEIRRQRALHVQQT